MQLKMLNYSPKYQTLSLKYCFIISIESNDFMVGNENEHFKFEVG
jgi:hypothetical protein